jgi:hypothetical protein
MRHKREETKDSGVYVDSLTYKDGQAVYCGGAMETHRQSHEMANNRIPSLLTQSSVEGDSGEFEEKDWTRADSSYGAAIPVAGWIPKAIRRTIEWTVIVSLLALFAFFVVTMSIRIRDDQGVSTSNKDAKYGYDTGFGYNDDGYVDKYKNANDDCVEDDVVAASDDEEEGVDDDVRF